MKSVCVLAALGAALFGTALATDPPQDDGVYIRLGAGASFVSDWEQSFGYNPAQIFVTPPPTGQIVENGEDLIAAFAVGFDYADGIRTELEYRYVSSDVEAVTVIEAGGPLPVAPTPDQNIQVQFLTPNFYFDLYNKTAFTPFIGGGVGAAFVRNETGMRDAVIAFQGRAGVSLDMGAGFSMDMEYLYARTKKMKFGPNPDDFTPAGPFGTAIRGARYESSSVLLSLRKLF